MSIFTAFMATCRREKSYLYSIIFHRLSHSYDKILALPLVLVLLDCRDSPVNSLHLRVKLLSNNPKITIQSLQMPWPSESLDLHKAQGIPSETEVSRTQCMGSREQPGKAAVLPGACHCTAWKCPHGRVDSFIVSPIKWYPMLVLKGSDVLNLNDALEWNTFAGWIAWFCHVHRSADGELWKPCWNKRSSWRKTVNFWTRERLSVPEAFYSTMLVYS